MRIEQKDLDKYPHLRKALGLPEQPQHSADDEIIPRELLKPPAPLPPIQVHHHGTDGAMLAMLLVTLACFLLPLGIIVGILSMQAPAMLIGLVIGLCLAGSYALFRKEHKHDE